MEAKHLDGNKPGLQHILAMPGLIDVAAVGDYGAKKYGDRWNYRKGMPWSKLLGSCARHLAAVCRGEDRDHESGLPHLAHLAFNALMLLEYMENSIGTDDRYNEVAQTETPYWCANCHSIVPGSHVAHGKHC